MRNFIVDDYYLSIYGTKVGDLQYSVQYNKKYADGRTIWYTEILNLNQINDLFDQLESLDRLTERKMAIIDSLKNSRVGREIKEKEEKLKRAERSLPTRLARSAVPSDIW
jgi:hypothetical protein